jgi:hypothetical protein
MKTKFKIGDWVLCSKTVEKKHHHYKFTPTAVKWESVDLESPIIAQVCGASYRYNGNISESGYGEDYEKYFIPKESIFVYELKLGMTNKPFCVLEEDLEPLSITWDKMELPFRYVHYNEADRKYLSEISKDYPRDKHGRFCEY